MANRFQFEGLEELKAALRRLPTDLTGEARNTIIGEANGAASDMKRAYPVRSGNLRDGLQVTHDVGPFSVGATIKNTAPHAWMFENGTQLRRTNQGWSRGAMPPGRVFIPRMIRARRALYVALKGMLTRKGLLVSGDAG